MERNGKKWDPGNEEGRRVVDRIRIRIGSGSDGTGIDTSEIFLASTTIHLTSTYFPTSLLACLSSIFVSLPYLFLV